MSTAKHVKHVSKRILIIFVLVLMTFNNIFTIDIHADEPDYTAEAEERKSEKVDTNEVPGWPEGPAIGAESAILMDADTGEILYAKNIDERLYPASTTKLMTCLVGIENASLDELVTVSREAIFANEADGSNMGLKEGEQLTVEELMYGILITSANEACNALGEHISGSMDGYVALMNQKAAELGCVNTHFVTTNGLQDDDHYSSARDLALIGREFFKYDLLCRLSSTAYYSMQDNGLHDAHELYSKNKLYKNREYAYEYLVGSKTGFTSVARQTLVSCAEKDGIRLICVIMKEETPYQFEDTIALFNYGFNNFYRINIASNETRYDISHQDFFSGESTIFENIAPVISLDTRASLLLPNGTDFSALTSDVTYDGTGAPYFGNVNYYFNGYKVGSAGIAFEGEEAPDNFMTLDEARAAAEAESLSGNETGKKTVIVNIWSVIKTIFIIFVIIVIVIVLWTVGKVYWNKYKKKIRWKKRFRDSQGISTRRDYNKSKRRRPSRGTSSVKSSESKQNRKSSKKRNDINFNDIKF